MEKSKGKRQADALLGGKSYFLLINSQKQVLCMYKKSSTFARQFAIKAICNRSYKDNIQMKGSVFMMKKCSMILMAVVCSLMAEAADYPYLVFTNTSGTHTSLSVAAMTLSVNGSELTVTNAAGTQCFTLTDLASMQFSKDGNVTSIEHILNGDAPVEVYSVTGVGYGTFSSMQEAAMDLPSGAYVVKQGGESQTVLVR